MMTGTGTRLVFRLVYPRYNTTYPSQIAADRAVSCINVVRQERRVIAAYTSRVATSEAAPRQAGGIPINACSAHKSNA